MEEVTYRKLEFSQKIEPADELSRDKLREAIIPLEDICKKHGGLLLPFSSRIDTDNCWQKTGWLVKGTYVINTADIERRIYKTEIIYHGETETWLIEDFKEVYKLGPAESMIKR